MRRLAAGFFNLFLPHTIELNRNVPPVVLTDLQIFNKSIHPGEKVNGDGIAGTPLWLRAEPGEDAAMAAAIVADIAAWSQTCGIS